MKVIIILCLWSLFSLSALACVVVGLAWVHPGLGLAAGGVIGLVGAVSSLPAILEAWC